MFKRIFSVTSLLLAANLAQPALASGCTNGKCGVVVFENTTWETINGVMVYDTTTPIVLATVPNLPPKATIKVYFDDKTTYSIRFTACQIFGGIPVGCSGINSTTANISPQTSCPYPQYKIAKIYFRKGDDSELPVPYVICK